MPPPVSVAKLLLDGVSYATTDKTVNDHVLSEVARKDCAVWRVIKGKPVCHAYRKGEQGLLETVADSLSEDRVGKTAAAIDTPVAVARVPVPLAGQLSEAVPAVASADTPAGR